MTTKRKGRVQDDAADYLEKLMGGPLTLGGALAAIRESDGKSLSEFSEQSQAQFVRLALQDQVRDAGLKLRVDVHAA
jgi:hypothetical protein